MEHTNFLTIVDHPSEPWHRSPIIIRDLDRQYIIAEFESVEQLDFFALTLGFTYEFIKEEPSQFCGTWKTYKLSHRIEKGSYGGFWRLSDLPDGAKPIKALSNGSIVTCYFTNDGENIRFYRPNPNAADIYHPLPLQDHLAHRRTYGLY